MQSASTTPNGSPVSHKISNNIFKQNYETLKQQLKMPFLARTAVRLTEHTPWSQLRAVSQRETISQQKSSGSKGKARHDVSMDVRRTCE